MSKETIAAVRAVAAELRLPGPIKPGLRKRLNEVRRSLREWLTSEEKREPGEYRQVRGPDVRKRVPKDNGGYRYETTPTLVKTDELLRGKLIKSTLYENIETLVELVAPCCSEYHPKAGRNKQDCAADIITQCDYIDGLQKNATDEVSTDEEVYKRVLKLFLEKWPNRESHSKLGKQMEEAITTAEWAAYRKVAMQSAKVGECCWKHFASKSKKEAEKQKK